MTAVCEIHTHLFGGCIVTRGPGNDSPQFIPAMKQAGALVSFIAVAADAGYDGEHNHRYCREALNIEQTIIPLNRRRGHKWPKEPYRRQMKTQFDKELYNQRGQIESAFSRNKRLLGSALRSRTPASQKRGMPLSSLNAQPDDSQVCLNRVSTKQPVIKKSVLLGLHSLVNWKFSGTLSILVGVAGSG